MHYVRLWHKADIEWLILLRCKAQFPTRDVGSHLPDGFPVSRANIPILVSGGSAVIRGIDLAYLLGLARPVCKQHFPANPVTL